MISEVRRLKQKLSRSLSHLSAQCQSGIKRDDIVSLTEFSTSHKHIFIWGLGQSGTFLLYDCLYFLLKNYGWRSYTVKAPRKKGLFCDLEFIKTQGFDAAPQEGNVKYWEPFWNLSIFTESSFSCLTEFEKFSKGTLNRSLCKTLLFYFNSLKVTHSRSNMSPLISSDLCFNFILDKSPYYMGIIPLIAHIFPNATHLYCVRDERSTINSQIKRLTPYQHNVENTVGYPSGFYGDIYASYLESLVEQPTLLRHALQHAHQIDFATTSLLTYKVKHFCVDFEDLIMSTEYVLREILNVCLTNDVEVHGLKETKLYLQHSQSLEIIKKYIISGKINKESSRHPNTSSDELITSIDEYFKAQRKLYQTSDHSLFSWLYKISHSYDVPNVRLS